MATDIVWVTELVRAAAPTTAKTPTCSVPKKISIICPKHLPKIAPHVKTGVNTPQGIGQLILIAVNRNLSTE